MNNLVKLSLIVSFVSLIACSTPSADIAPGVKIPDLPPSVRYTEPKLPNKAVKDSKETAEVLKKYEEANKNNKFAIDQAKKHNRNLQKTYNTPVKKETESSDWIKNPLTGDWKMW